MSDRARAAVQAQTKAAPAISSVAGSVLQRAAINTAPIAEVPEIVQEVLNAPGQTLDPDTKAFMESRFGYDFSQVRVHTDEKAAESAKSVNALAYTVGKNISFGAGQYAPETREGKRLLAHELTHVVQQDGQNVCTNTTRISAPTDGSEQVAEHVSTQIAIQNENVASPVPLPSIKDGTVTGLLHRKPNKANTPAQAQGPTWDEAFTVLQAIIDIINKYVYEDKSGLVHSKAHPLSHPDVPAQYQQLLREWFFITHGTVKDGNLEISIRGAFLKTHIEMALADTKPLIAILIKQGNQQTEPWLKTEFFAPVNQFKARALSEEVEDSIQRGADIAASRPDALANMSEEEKQKKSVADALSTVRLALTVITRYTNSVASQNIKELNKQFADALTSAPSGEVTEAVRLKAVPIALMYIKAGLDGLNAILSATDPQKRDKLLKQHAGVLGTIAKDAEIAKIVFQFVSGATAVIGASYVAIARMTGNQQKAIEVLGKIAPVLSNISFVLNVLGVIHGAFVLFDSSASNEARLDAVLEIGLGGVGVAARIAGLAASASAIITLGIALDFYAMKAALQAYGRTIASLIRLGLTICYKDMQANAHYISDTALKMTVGLQLIDEEKDIARKNELIKQVDGLRWNLKNSFLIPYIARATKQFGASNADPGAYEPLRTRFLPLLGRPLDTDAQLLQVTQDLLSTMEKSMRDAQIIFVETVKWAAARHSFNDRETSGSAMMAGGDTSGEDTPSPTGVIASSELQPIDSANTNVAS